MNNHIMSAKSNAYLEVILGPMYSGKTSLLVEIHNELTFHGIPVAAINHTIDDRYEKDSFIVTHSGVKIPCLKAGELKQLWKPDIKQYSCKEDGASMITKYSSVILINEGQFFSDLFEVVNDMLKHGKKVYVCGLDGDFERKKFGQILDLIPLCDKVTKLSSECAVCNDGTPAIFSKRLSSETEQTVVGSDNYIPVCRACYDSRTANDMMIGIYNIYKNDLN